MKVRRMHRSFTRRRLHCIHGTPATDAALRAEKQNEPSDRTARAYDKGQPIPRGAPVAAGAAGAGRPEAAERGEPPDADR